MGRSVGASNANGPLHKNGAYIKQNNKNEYELENGQKKLWKNTFEGKYQRDLVNNIEGGDTVYTGNDSEERLRGVTPPDASEGIYKSTRIEVSRLPIQR